MKCSGLATLMLILAAATSAHAECLTRAQPVIHEGRSPNGQWSVRVISGGRGNPPGTTAEWYRPGDSTPQKLRTAALLNPFAPNDFLVTNDGTLVTFDDWCGWGGERAVVIFSPGGDVVRKYSFEDLYSGIKWTFGSTGEGTIWRCYSAPSLVLSPSKDLLVGDDLSVADAQGGRFVFTLATGSFRYERAAGRCSDP